MDEKDRFLELVRGLFLAGTLTGDQASAVKEAALDMANELYWKGRRHERMTWVAEGQLVGTGAP